MLKQRTPSSIAGRSLPQRNEQFNNYPHLIYVSPRLIRKVGFDSRAILADAEFSGREIIQWTKKTLEGVNRVVKRHIFGFFVISLSTLQFLPAVTNEAPTYTQAKDRQVEYLFEDSVKAKEAPIFQRPVQGYLSQSFWYFHPAIDIPNPYGAVIKPIAEGEVLFMGWDGGYGYTIIVKHTAGFSSRYAHLSQIFVKKGARVDKKTTIGTVGTTGFATGSHLHLELYNEGRIADPQEYLPKN